MRRKKKDFGVFIPKALHAGKVLPMCGAFFCAEQYHGRHPIKCISQQEHIFQKPPCATSNVYPGNMPRAAQTVPALTSWAAGHTAAPDSPLALQQPLPEISTHKHLYLRSHQRQQRDTRPNLPDALSAKQLPPVSSLRAADHKEKVRHIGDDPSPLEQTGITWKSAGTRIALTGHSLFPPGEPAPAAFEQQTEATQTLSNRSSQLKLIGVFPPPAGSQLKLIRGFPRW